MYPKEMKRFNLASLSLHRIPEIKTNWPQAFFAEKICRNTENYLFSV